MAGATSSENSRSPPSISAHTNNSSVPLQQHPLPPSSFAHPGPTNAQRYAVSPRNERNVGDRIAPNAFSGREVDYLAALADSNGPQILIRRLPATISKESLISLLLFAEDFLEANVVSGSPVEDAGFTTAIARFQTWEGASEARSKLNGKPNAANDATMVVEIVGGTPPSIGSKFFDTQISRQLSTSASSGASSSSHAAGRQASRFNGAFQSMDKIPVQIGKGHSITNGDLVDQDSINHMQNIFSPKSPVGSSFTDRPRVTGKSMINDAGDDETGELLKDPVAYAKSGQGTTPQRRLTNTQPPISRFNNLSLNTADANNLTSPIATGFPSARSIPPPLQSPISDMPLHMNNSMAPLSPNGNFPVSPPQYARHHYPPANPADQNPPCNTLYVGNLPVDTSEDELKQMFSKQRGYKRLCFRTKHNGPMCFVEFEDVSFATKALNELYGHPLHNSVKGGIRLSFSKNPLGVRTGQSMPMGIQSPLTSPTAVGSMSGGLTNSGGFTTVNGPPPGLAVPPGLSPPLSMAGTNGVTQSMGHSFFAPNASYNNPSIQSSFNKQAAQDGQPSTSSDHTLSPTTGNFTAYMMGR